MTDPNNHTTPLSAETDATTDTTTAPLSAEQLAALQAEATKTAENWDRYLRAVADLDNFKKRAERERQEAKRASQEQVVAALLPVLDNLERALDAAHKLDAKNDALLQGIDQVQVQFRRTLEQFGLEEVKAHAGHPFDPNFHEAVSHVDSDEHPDGVILNQLQRGYKMANRLLRPARVVVSKGPQGKDDQTESRS
jgi:molecular chaperone GrpE